MVRVGCIAKWSMAHFKGSYPQSKMYLPKLRERKYEEEVPKDCFTLNVTRRRSVLHLTESLTARDLK